MCSSKYVVAVVDSFDAISNVVCACLHRRSLGVCSVGHRLVLRSCCKRSFRVSDTVFDVDMLGDDEDVFESVAWETPSAGYQTTDIPTAPTGPGFKQSTDDDDTEEGRGPNDPKWEGYLIPCVQDPIKELGETKDAFVSYLVTAKVSNRHPTWSDAHESLQTNSRIFSTPNPSSRRRFQDFVFLKEHLSDDFPACVVPPLPEKHRLGSSVIQRRRCVSSNQDTQSI